MMTVSLGLSEKVLAVADFMLSAALETLYSAQDGSLWPMSIFFFREIACAAVLSNIFDSILASSSLGIIECAPHGEGCGGGEGGPP